MPAKLSKAHRHHEGAWSAWLSAPAPAGRRAGGGLGDLRRADGAAHLRQRARDALPAAQLAQPAAAGAPAAALPRQPGARPSRAATTRHMSALSQRGLPPPLMLGLRVTSCDAQPKSRIDVLQCTSVLLTLVILLACPSHGVPLPWHRKLQRTSGGRRAPIGAAAPLRKACGARSVAAQIPSGWGRPW